MRGEGWFAVGVVGLVALLGLGGVWVGTTRPERWVRVRPAMVAGGYFAALVLLGVGAIVQFPGGSARAGARVWKLAFLLLALATGGAFAPPALGVKLVTAAAVVAAVGTLVALWGV
jgi:hypothetical protein